MIIKVPLHVSGLWIPHYEKDPLRTGSTGAGLNLGLTCVATPEPADCSVVLEEGSSLWNSSPSWVIQTCGEAGISVRTRVECPVPIRAGFAVSSAIAISHSLASFLLAGKGSMRALQHAHRVEVETGGGLGDVLAQYVGGFEIRVKPGAPGVGEAYRVLTPENPALIVGVLRGEEETGGMLKRITQETYEHGADLLTRVIESESLLDFFASAKDFTKRVFDYSRVQVLERARGVVGYYLKKSALIVWVEREYMNDVLDIVNGLTVKSFSTTLSQTGVVVENPR